MPLQAQWPKIPAKRVATVEEISAAVVFLASPAAAYVSGATVNVDGAASLYRSNTPGLPDHSNMPVYGRRVPPKATHAQADNNDAMSLLVMSQDLPTSKL